MCITLYETCSSKEKCATNDLSPVEPFSTVTLVCKPSILLPVHPSKTYPLFVGLIKSKESVSTVYLVGLVPFTCPSSKSYSILYSIGVSFASNFESSFIGVLKLYTSPSKSHPSNLYPGIFGSSGISKTEL